MTTASLICIAANPSIDRLAEVDRLVPGTIHRPTAVVGVPGGKALNVARAAHELGLGVEVIALLAGHAGRWIHEELQSGGVPSTPIWISGETRSCLSVLDRSTGSLTEFYEPGPRVEDREWTRLEEAALRRLRANSGGAKRHRRLFAVLSGSAPPGPADDALGHLASSLGGRAADVIVDTSGIQLRHAIGARPWLVKVNAAEASSATGLAVDGLDEVLSAAAALLRMGAARALITRGKLGAVLMTEAGAWEAGPPPVVGPYSVGSGDALLAGFIAAALRGDEPDACLRLGSAAGAANAMVAGQGHLDAETVGTLGRLIRVRRIAADGPKEG